MEIAAGSKVCAVKKKVGDGVKIGENVIIECDNLVMGKNVAIGVKTDENFRDLPGTRIRANSLVLEENVTIGRGVSIRGGTICLKRGVVVKHNNTMNVVSELQIGDNGTVNENCEISGRDIKIGQELWMLPYAKIGGGSGFEIHSKLRIGDYCHIGMYCFLNTARPIYIGDEVGLGTRTCLYTHGAYSSALSGFPVAFGEIHIGHYSWIPGAIINPGVKIGKNCVIGVNSLVTRDIPDGCLAAGSPAKIIKEKVFPRVLSRDERANFFHAFLKTFGEICCDRHTVQYADDARVGNLTIDETIVVFTDFLSKKDLEDRMGRIIFIAETTEMSEEALNGVGYPVTVFNLKDRYIYGFADRISERLMNQLRRYGIRFYARSDGKKYVKWK